MRTKTAVICLLLLAGGVVVASDEHDHGDEHYAVHIPEPMVFDMVRGLGAHKGEFEANVLAEIPLNDTGNRDVAWAPEIEYAIFDGVALEFELPFEDGKLEAYKFAAQFTFGTAFDDRFIHGTQFIAEKFDGEDLWELTALYIPAVRFDENWSAIVMLGLRTELGDDGNDETDVLFNLSVFKDLRDDLTFGVETDVASELDGDSHVLFMPQVHYEINDRFEIQGGIGAEFVSQESNLTAAFRFIYSR